MYRAISVLLTVVALFVLLPASAQASHSSETACWLSPIIKPFLTNNGKVVRGGAQFNCHIGSIKGAIKTTEVVDRMTLTVALQRRNADNVWQTRDVYTRSVARSDKTTLTTRNGNVKVSLAEGCLKVIGKATTRQWRSVVVAATAYERDGERHEFDWIAGQTARLTCG